jgi:hypothetical protein
MIDRSEMRDTTAMISAPRQSDRETDLVDAAHAVVPAIVVVGEADARVFVAALVAAVGAVGAADACAHAELGVADEPQPWSHRHSTGDAGAREAHRPSVRGEVSACFHGDEARDADRERGSAVDRWIAIGVSRLVTVEAGGDFSANGWAMGFAGARVTGRVPVGPRLRLVGDTELGVGAGVGGTYCTNGDDERCNEDGRRWHERLAGGGYGGIGGALRWRIPAIFTRLRVQPTGAVNVPITVWTTWQSGLELRFADAVSLWASVGLADYHDRWDHGMGGIYEIGLAIRLTRR